MSVESSRETFLEALERLLSRPEAAPPGVNAVAREAGLNKVLVYRYFQSWDGLLEAFAQRVNPWRDLRKETEAGLASGRWTRLPDLLKWLYRAYLGQLAGSHLLQNLLRLSLTHRDPLQMALEKDREEEGLALMGAVAARFSLPEGTDPAALTAVLTGGLTWLILTGTRAGTFNGLQFTGSGADAVERLGSAIDVWAESLTTTPRSGNL